MRGSSSSSSWWFFCSYLFVFGYVLWTCSVVAAADQWIPSSLELGLSSPQAPRAAVPSFMRFATAVHLDPVGSPQDHPPVSVWASSTALDPTDINADPLEAFAMASPEPSGEAAAVWSGSYIAFRLMPSLSNVDNISRNPSAPIFLEDGTIEAVAAASIAVGYDWRRRLNIPLKTELEYRYRYHFDIDTESPTSSSSYDVSTKALHTIQLNAWFPWNVADGVDLLIGGGVGVTFDWTESIRTNTITKETEKKTTTWNDNFSWHVGLGADYRFAENWSVEAMYRYASLGEITIGPFSTGDSVSYGRTFSHEFVFGIAYHL